MAIQKEFDQFKKDNPGADIISQRVTTGTKISFKISCGSVELYDRFIEHLAHHLVPNANPVLHSKQQAHLPMSMEPKPSTSDGVQGDEANPKEKPFHPSPFLIVPKPHDDL